MLVRNIVIGAAVAAVVTLGGTAAANADEMYPPTSPGGPSLAGSVTVGECHSDAPWIDYDIALTDGDAAQASAPASLSLSSGANSVTIPLGNLENGHLSGRVLWPGAAVDENGTPTQWPGWAEVDGEWVETGANYGWTRGAVTAQLSAGVSESVGLVYPTGSPECAPLPAGVERPFTETGGPSDLELAFTGGNGSVAGLALAGGALALLGGGVIVGRRVAARRTATTES